MSVKLGGLGDNSDCYRHPGKGRDLSLLWTPAFAGVTRAEVLIQCLETLHGR